MPPIPKLLLPILLLVVFYSSGQISQAPANEWFDQVIGRQNTGIFNGVEYIEQHRTINDKHKFFLSAEFLPGAVNYSGQPYPGVELRYNIFEDLLIINISSEGRETFFQLIKEKIDQFSIAGHLFLNVKDSETHKGFAEILHENAEVMLLKKYYKSLRKKKDKDFVYFEFKLENPLYLLRWRGEYFELDSRRDVIDLFPELKKEVREYYSSNRSIRKRDPDAFMKDLFEFISSNMKKTQVPEV